MNTVIQFIGLFIVTTLSPTGLHIILPHVTVAPPHPSFIAYRKADLVSQKGFPPRGTFVYHGETFEWTAVHNEVIEFAGATGPLTGDASNLPHLTCCCAAMRDGLKRAYADSSLPASRRRSAHFLVRAGDATVVSDPTGSLVTQVSMASTSGITLRASSTRFLTFRPAAPILIGHEPLPGSAPATSHFHAYYQTGRNPAAAACIATPVSDPATCGPRPAGCDVPVTEVTTAPTRRGRARVENENPDCSNSHWP